MRESHGDVVVCGSRDGRVLIGFHVCAHPHTICRQIICTHIYLDCLCAFISIIFVFACKNLLMLSRTILILRHLFLPQATAPTRRLVSHSGVDSTLHATVPWSLASSPSPYLLQHLVVSVDQSDHFALQLSDLYPLPDASKQAQVFYREASIEGASECVAGADAVASGCISVVASTSGQLFDVTTRQHVCSAGPDQCMHSFGVWQVWVVDEGNELVVLGDLSAYVSLSGYRWRLPANSTKTTPITHVIAVGEPGEVVSLTYLRKSGGKWLVHVMPISIGADGRAMAVLK